jgi:hypothetical protein
MDFCSSHLLACLVERAGEENTEEEGIILINKQYTQA